jgi:hypothetical protein
MAPLPINLYIIQHDIYVLENSSIYVSGEHNTVLSLFRDAVAIDGVWLGTGFIHHLYPPLATTIYNSMID